MTIEDSMSQNVTSSAEETLDVSPAIQKGPDSQRPWLRKLAFSNISAVYVGIALVILFSVWVPSTFLTTSTLTTLLSEQAITGIIAVALVLPFAAGAFDLSFAYNVGFGAILSASLVGNHGFPVWAAMLIVIATCGAVGATNGFFAAVVGINPVIATLAVGSCLSAGINWISGGNEIIGLSNGFVEIANNKILGVGLPVYYLAVIALFFWYMLEYTPPGRYLYAVGGNSEAARLAGVRTGLVVFCSLAVVGVVSGFAGVLVTSQVSAGYPSVGPAYLLPALAGVFLGSTQLHPGRFNVWGTLISVYVLAIGVKGLQLAGAPFWLPDMFNGLALLIAVGISQRDYVMKSIASLRRLKAVT
jgi:ribose transport system permease protein